MPGDGLAGKHPPAVAAADAGPMTFTLNRRPWLARLAAAAALPAGAASQEDAWLDRDRGRELPWRARLPAAPGPWPLLLYSHGLGGSRDGGDVWGDAWRAAGFAVVHLQHPGSDTAALRGGASALRDAVKPEQLIARTADLAFMLDEITRRAQAGQAPWREVRLDAVGLAGHSYGAQTAQAVAGQRFAVPAELSEPRVKAFIALSPSSSRVRLSPQQQFSAVTRPFLAVTGSDDGDPFGSFTSGETRAAVYDGLPPGQRALLWLDGADHMTFAGNGAQRINGRGWFRRGANAWAREPVHHALVARITTLWWRAQLLGDAAARVALAAPEGLAAADRWRLG